MRKGRDGEMEWNGKWKMEKENNGENSGHYVVASRPPNGDRLQRRRSCQKSARFVGQCYQFIGNITHFLYKHMSSDVVFLKMTMTIDHGYFLFMNQLFLVIYIRLVYIIIF